VSAVEPRGFAPLGRAGDAVVETAREWLPQPIWDLRRDIDERMARIPTRLNSYGYDAWGFHPATAARAMFTMALLYRYWFRVQVHGIERIPPGRVLLISNHAGQIALDAAMIGISTFLDNEPPRVVRGMGEYWLPTVPWINELMVRSGSVVGTRKNCIDLLANEEAVIAFPEGVRGMNKLIWERYQLQEFGHGFMRLALETGAPIVPIAVVGSEEQAPGIANLRPLARLLRMPAFPITLTFPALGPLGLVPLPVKYHIYFGEPMSFDGNPSDEDEVIAEKVEQVKAQIATMLTQGLAQRRSLFW
jgi:1-acyl-sn-glycerol-3-phosphate acyltransferase